MKAATQPSSRLMRDLFRVEPLEPRVLLSADPIAGAAQIVLRPADDDGAALLAQAYEADAGAQDTSEVAQVALRQPVTTEWLEVDSGQLEEGNGEVAMRTMAFAALAASEPFLLDTDIDTPGDIPLLESVLVRGDRILTAGNDGTGQIQIGADTSNSLNGDGVAGNDTLVLRTPDNIYFSGAVGSTDPLEGLTIEGVVVSGVENRPQDVTFTRAVVVDGDLVITASGTVIFNDRVEVTGGGDLRIIGAEQVIFRAGVVLSGVDAGNASGDLFIEANEISFQGGEESVSGQGVLTLRPTDVTAGIELGTPPTSQQIGVLNISNEEIRAFTEGFSRIVVGHQAGAQAAATAGTVRIGAINALDQPTLRDPLEVYGGTIIVEDYSTSDYEFQVEGTITLVAHNNIVLRNQVEASVGGVLANIRLYSHVGRVLQEDATLDQATAEPLRAATLTVRAATGISLGFTEITTLHAENVTSGTVTITETAAGGSVDVDALSHVGADGLSLRTLAGNITVGGSGISHAGSGATVLQASGTGSTITVNEAIQSAAGLIRLTAEGAITTSDDATNDGTIVTGGAAAVELTSNAGAITQGGLIQSAGGAVSLDAFTTLTMADGVVVRSHTVTDDGSVSLRARGGNVVVSAVDAGSALSITAAGSILDGLTGDGPNLDADAGAVLLTAAGAIGAAGGALQTRVNALSAVATTGGIFVQEATGLRIAGGATAFSVDTGSGPVVIATTDGAITVEGQVRSGGNLLLQTRESGEGTDAGLLVQAAVTAAGSISLRSADGIGLDNAADAGPAVTAGTGQTVDLEATDAIVMDAGATLAALDGKARMRSFTGDVTLGAIDVGTGSVAVRAGGSILDAQADDAGTRITNVTAGAVRLNAGDAIGTSGAMLDIAAGTVAAIAGGSAFLHETGAVVVGEVAPVTVNRVDVNGTTVGFTDPMALSGLAIGGTLVLRSEGELQVARGVQAAGNLLLSAGAGMQLAANVATTGGNVSVRSGQALALTGSTVLSTTAGTIDVQADAGGIAMDAAAAIQTAAGNIRVAATGGVLTVGRIDARTGDDRTDDTLDDAGAWGDVSLVAGTLRDNAGDSAIDVHARNLRLEAGAIGTATEHLQVQVTGTLAAAATAGGLFLSDPDALALGLVGGIATQRVGFAGTSAAAPVDADASGTNSSGAQVVRAEGGALAVGGAGVVAGGNLLLQALGAGGSVTIGAAVQGSGHISIRAAADLVADAGIAAIVADKTVDLTAAGAITQAQGTAITSAGGNVSVDAGGLLTLEAITAAGAGSVWVRAASIVDGDAAGDGETDITAAGMQVITTVAVGTSGNALETSVQTLSVAAGGEVFLAEANGLVVGGLQVNVQRVGTDGASAATSHAGQQGLAGGTVALTVAAGGLQLAADVGTVTAAGALLLDAAGAIDAQAQASAVGHLSVLGASITQAAAGDFLAGGTIDVEARSGAIGMADGAVARTEGGSIRYAASGNVTVGQLDARGAGLQATWGAVSVKAGGAILDNAETAVDVYANALRLEAVAGIATGDERLETEVALLAAAGGTGGVFLAEASAVAIGSTAAISVFRVDAFGTIVTSQTDPALSGLDAGAQAVVTTTDGTLTVGQGVTAGGNLLLAAGGTGNLDVAAAVASSGGDLSLQAGADLLLSANVAANGSQKTLDLVAGGALTQSQGTALSTNSGNVSLAAGGVATLESVVAGGPATGIRISAASIVDGDAAGDTEVDLVAATVQLLATGAIGAAGAQLETTTSTLAIDADGDVFLNNTGALVVGSTTVDVGRVGSTGASVATTHGAVAGLAGDDVVVRALTGNFTVNTGAAIGVTGNLLLQAVAAGSNLTLGAAITATGAVSLAAGNDVLLNASLTTTGSAASTVDVLATTGRIVQAQNTAITTADANVQLDADASVTLELVQAGTGNLRIDAGQVFDGDTAVDETEVDVVAAGLQITSASSVGAGSNALETRVDRLAVRAGAGTITIVESNGLVLGSVSTSVNRVGLAGVAGATALLAESNVTGSTVVVRTLDGSLESVAGGAVVATGNVLLRAAGTTSDLVLGAAVSSTNGHVGIEAGQDLLQNAGVTLAGAKSLDLRAGRNLAQAQGVATSTAGGNASLTAGGTLTLESVAVRGGSVALFGASIVDGDADGDTEVDVQALAVRFQASNGAIGSSLNALETTTSSLAVSATGDVFVAETDGVQVETVSVPVTRVLNNGSNGAVEAVATTALGGRDVVVRTGAGPLAVLSTGAITATRNVLLQAGGNLSDLSIAGIVASSGGHVSLHAGQDLTLNANVAATGADKTIDLVAGRNLVQAQGTNIISVGGNIALQAAGSASIELVNAGTGAVRIAAASVIDSDAGLNEAELDVVANALVLQVSGSTGSNGNALETSVAALAAAGGGNLFLLDNDTIATRSLTVNVQRVAANAGSALTGNGAVAGLAAATTVVRTTAGGLTVEAGAAVVATGNLLLQAGGTGALTVQDSVSGAGHVTLQAGGNLQQSANIAATTAARTLHLQAAGTITQQQGVTASSLSGPLSLQAGGNVTLARLEAGLGTVRIVGANVIDVDADGDAAVDIVAGELQLKTAAVGSGANALETTVGRLAADASGDLFVDNSAALAIGATSVTVSRVGQNGSATADAVANLNGIAGGGAAVVRATGGALTTSAVSGTVTVAGNLLLQAVGADLRVGAALASSTGHISLAAGQDLLLDATVQAQGAGKSIDLTAARSIVQAQGTSVIANGGNVALEATSGSTTVETIAAGSGGVLVRGGALVDGDAAGDAEIDITAAVLQIVSGGAVGAAGAAIETDVGTLAADAGGNIFLTEANALAVGGAALTVQRVGPAGTTAATPGVATSGLTGGGNVVLRTVAGNLSTTADTAVQAAGNLLLRAGGTGSDLTLDGAVAAGGSITVDAARDLLQNAQVTATTAGKGLELLAGADFVQAQGVSASVDGGVLYVMAGGNATLESLHAGAGVVRLQAVDVIDGDDAGDPESDITASGLALMASGTVGTGTDALETTIERVAGFADGGLFLTETDALVLGAVDFEGQAVGVDGAAGSSGAYGFSGLSGGDVAIRTLAGDLSSEVDNNLLATGNLRLASAAGFDIVLAGAISNDGGSTTVDSGGDLALDAAIDASGTGQTIELLAALGITQAQGTAVTTADGAIVLRATTDITLESLDAGTASVRIEGRSVLDGDAAGDGEVDIVAGGLLVAATGSVGASGAALETSVSRVSATATGDIFLTEDDDVEVGLVEVTVRTIGADGAATAVVLQDQSVLRGGTIVLRTLDGALDVLAGSDVSAQGNLLLAAGGAGGHVALFADVTATGALSIDAGGDLVLEGTLGTTDDGATIDVVAGGAIDAREGSSIATVNGNIRLQAGGTLTLESMVAGAGSVGLTAAALVDGDQDEDEDGREVDISASGLQVTVTGDVAALANALETSVATLSVDAGGTIAIAESDDLLLDTVATTVDRVGADGMATSLGPLALSDVVGGHIEIQVLDGSLESTTDGTITGTSHIVLVTEGDAADVVLGGSVTSNGGQITLSAGGDLLQNADIAVTGSGDTLLVEARGDLTQAEGVAIRSNDGHAAVLVGGALTLETIDAGAGNLLLFAGSIVDGDADGDTGTDLFASGLIIETRAGSAGGGANALETEVDTLAAKVRGGDLFLREADAVSLEEVAVVYTIVSTGDLLIVQAPYERAGVAGGTVVIRTADGALAVQASGAVDATGNVLLEAGGAGADLSTAAAVRSAGGDITLVADRDLLLGADVTADGEGASIAMVAGNDVAQDPGTAIATVDGIVDVEAGGVLTVESITAGTGAVSIAAASIVDGDTDPDDAEVDIAAGALVLQGAVAIGAAGNAIETTVGQLAVGGGGNLFLTETDALELASLSVQAQRVGADGLSADAAERAVAGMDSGTTVLRTLDGALTVLAGSDVMTGGNTLLAAGGEEGDLVLRAELAVGGDLSLVAGRDLLQFADLGAVVAGASVVLSAEGDVTQAQGTTARAAGGILAVEAGGDFRLADLQAGGGAVRITADAVIDVDGNNTVDIVADVLQLRVGGAVGSGGNAVETQVGTLGASAAGALFLADVDALAIGATLTTVRRVGADGASTADDAIEVSGLEAGAAAVVQALAGSLEIDAAVSVAGNLLLRAGGVASDLVVDAGVTSTGGHVSLDAGRDLALNANLAASGAGRTVELHAGGDIAQAQGTGVTTADGAIALEAGGSVTLERLAAGTAGVRIAAAAIIDGDLAGDDDADIEAGFALLASDGAIGAAGADLETSVARLSAHAGGDLFIAEASGLVLDTVTVNVQHVTISGGTATTVHAAQAGVAGATVVVRTVAGDLASTAAGAVTAGGNLLLQAGGAGSTLTLAAATTATGHVSLQAQAALALEATASVTATGGGSSIDLLAGGAFTGAQGSLVRTAGGNLLLQAGGAVRIDTVDAGAGSVRITGASISDGASSPDGGADILAGQVLLTATGSVGTASNALSTSAGTLTVQAGGTVSILETDALVLGTVTASQVERVGADGGTSSVAAVTQSGVAGTTVTVRAVAGGIDITDDITGTGAIALRASGTIAMGPGVEVRTGGDANIVVTSEAGSVLMDPDTGVLRTGSGDIHLTAEIDIRPGALVTTGFAYLDARDGRVLIQGDLQRNGEDIDIFANDVTIEEPVSSPGGTLRIGPLEVVPVIVGGRAPSGAALHLDTTELAFLRDGFRQIVIGSNLKGQVVEFRGTDATLVFRDPLVVNASGAGGKVLVTGKLRGDALTLLNSGTSTTLRDATITMARSVQVEDQLVIRGANAILGAQSSGAIRFMQTVTGYGGSGDKLTLDANGRDMRFDKAVTKLDGLTIRDADDVSFLGAVTVSGDLVIEAKGTVTFGGKLTLTNGGRLIISGGGKVVFGAGADLGQGDHLLKVAAISAKGGTGSIRGTGELEVRGPASSTPIHIGSGAPRGALVIGDTFLRAIGKGFDALQIGGGSAKVTIGATDLRSTASPVQVEGKTIALKGSGSGVRLGTDLTLHASGAITASGKIVASKAVDIALDSDKGAITMAKGASIRSLGGDVSLEAAKGLLVADIDARGTRGAPGLVHLESTKGTISDANRDKAIDIYARGVTMKGLGPKAGSGDVLEVGAHVVRIIPPGGNVLREADGDGRSYFNVLQGRNLYQSMVVVGPVTRVTSNVETYLSRMTNSELSFSSGQAIKRGSQVNYWSETIDL